jgi:hypothetical protein
MFAMNITFGQTNYSFNKKRPAEIELLNYSKLLKSSFNKYNLKDFKVEESFQTIFQKYGTYTLLTNSSSDLKELNSLDSTLIYEFEIINNNFKQDIKERTTILKQPSGDNRVHFYEANGELTLKLKLIDAKTNILILEQSYSSSSSRKGLEKDNSHEAPIVDLTILKESCVNTIVFSILKGISDWNQQINIEFEEDNKFSELPNVVSMLNGSNWLGALEILKKYANDDNFKSKQKAKAYYNFAILLMHNGSFEDAELFLKKANELFPKEKTYKIAFNQLNEEKKLAQILIERKIKSAEELEKFKTEQDLIIKKEKFIFSNIYELESKTGIKELKTLLFPENPDNPDNDTVVFDFADGSFEYNIVKEKKEINGNIEIYFGTPGFSNNIRGNIKNGEGYLTIDFFNNEFDYSFGILKLNFSQNICKSLRFEKRIISNDSLYYFETDNIKSFNLEQKLYESSGLLKVNKTILKPQEFPLVRYLGYFDGEREGSDYEQKEFKFIAVKKVSNKIEEFGNVIDIKTNDVPSSMVSTLKNPNSLNSFYKLNSDLAIFKSEVYDHQDTLIILKKLEKVLIFDVENYANNYNEKISSADLNSLNVLVKKWVNAIADGNYDAYKSLTPKAALMNLQDFGKANAEFSRKRESMIFQNSSKYIITTVDVFSPTNTQFEELKKTGCSINYVAVLYGNFKHFSEKEGVSLIKENGVWKVVTIGKYGNTTSMKALYVMSKENITACGCVQDVIEGNQFEADKCAYYIRNTRLMYQTAEFENCFSTANYCDFIAQSKKLGVSFYSTNKFSKCASE